MKYPKYPDLPAPFMNGSFPTQLASAFKTRENNPKKAEQYILALKDDTVFSILGPFGGQVTAAQHNMLIALGYSDHPWKVKQEEFKPPSRTIHHEPASNADGHYPTGYEAVATRKGYSVYHTNEGLWVWQLWRNDKLIAEATPESRHRDSDSAWRSACEDNNLIRPTAEITKYYGFTRA